MTLPHGPQDTKRDDSGGVFTDLLASSRGRVKPQSSPQLGGLCTTKNDRSDTCLHSGTSAPRLIQSSPSFCNMGQLPPPPRPVSHFSNEEMRPREAKAVAQSGSAVMQANFRPVGKCRSVGLCCHPERPAATSP